MNKQGKYHAHLDSWLVHGIALALCLTMTACQSNDQESDTEGDQSQAGMMAGGMAGDMAGNDGAGSEGGTVPKVVPVGVQIIGPEAILVHDRFTLSAQLLLSDDSNDDETHEYTWESLTPNASISATGEVYVEGEGEVKIKATYQDVTGEWVINAGCSYPGPTGAQYNNALAHNTVIPPLSWPDSYTAKNSTSTDVSLKTIYCKANFKWVSTINILTTAGWCPACPDYLRAVADMNPELKEAGGLLIYVDVQDNDYAPANSDFANEHLSRLLGSTEGYFVGDVNSEPISRFFGQSPTIDSFPDAYVIRRRDMMILTSQNVNRASGMVPFLQIAQDPEQDWSMYTPAPPPPFESICEEGDDEPSEPNDTPMTAGALTEGINHGGICTPEPDFYFIDTEGSWEVILDFNHDEADLDLYQINPNLPLEDQMPIQSSAGETNQESLMGVGPATIMVNSYSVTSTLYTIELTLTP